MAEHSADSTSGAATVLSTDKDDRGLEVGRQTADLNHVSNVKFQTFDWTADSFDGSRASLVIGADILYLPDSATFIIRALANMLAPSGVCIITDPGRPAATRFIEACSAANLACSVVSVQDVSSADCSLHILRAIIVAMPSDWRLPKASKELQHSLAAMAIAVPEISPTPYESPSPRSPLPNPLPVFSSTASRSPEEVSSTTDAVLAARNTSADGHCVAETEGSGGSEAAACDEPSAKPNVISNDVWDSLPVDHAARAWHRHVLRCFDFLRSHRSLKQLDQAKGALRYNACIFEDSSTCSVAGGPSP